MALEVGEIVLCTVDGIVGTNVFVKLESGEEGVIVFSEIAPGRIRNIRDYVVPKKKIACKVLRLSHGRIELSLRRVTLKEQKELKETYKAEKSYESILKSILGEKSEQVKKEIRERGNLYDFLSNAKANPKELEKIAGKDNSKKILDIIKTQQRRKIISVKKEISLTTTNLLGLELIKNLLGKIGDVETRYLASGRYVLKIDSDDAKKAEHELIRIIESLEKDAKKAGMEFSIVKK